jgi:hypothetical protein
MSSVTPDDSSTGILSDSLKASLFLSVRYMNNGSVVSVLVKICDELVLLQADRFWAELCVNAHVVLGFGKNNV